MRSSYPGVDANSADESKHRQQMARVITNLNGGKLNAVADITLNASATSTILTDSRIGPASHITLEPVTSDALKAKQAGLFVSARVKGSCTISHASASATDQTFTMLIIG